MENVRELTRKIKIGTPIRFDEPMREHTSLRIGGSADVYAAPRTTAELRELLDFCKNAHVPFFILGGGTNILVSDRGFRGVVIDMSGIHGILREGDEVIAYSGTSMADVGTFALSQSLSGLEFSSGLPGSVGGAVWMNARCYEKSISDVLVRTEVLETDGTIRTVATVPSEWGYKLSPFRKSGGVILRARFHLQSGAPEAIRSEMALRRADREAKGHFLHACAGSMFKNNRDFGAPTGKLIDSLGLKGRRIGDAVIPPYHGNFIVNLGNASARDVLSLIELIEGEVGGKLGFALEREVLLVGDWQAS